MNARISFARDLREHPDSVPELEFAWLEGLVEARLVRKTAPGIDWRSINQWPEGRLFGEAGEYRWRRTEEGDLHAVLLLDRGRPPQLFSGEIELEAEGDSELHLWGEWVDPQADAQANPDGGARFYAPEIPRALAYPLDLGDPPHSGKEVRLVVRRYRDRSRGHGEYVRALGLKIVRSTKEAEHA